MKVIENVQHFRKFQKIKLNTYQTGFVPTMGNLHAGHVSLLKKARLENEKVILSIFTNPKQFDSVDDFKHYPKTIDQDLALAKQCGVDVVFIPCDAELYPDHYRYQVHEILRSKILCGAHRLGHFSGVLTIVLKLLMLVKPTRAYFGEKDYQQMQLVKDMIDAFFLDTILVACPLIRDTDGLPLSSRNKRLTPKARENAAYVSKLIQSDLSDQELICDFKNRGLIVDYVETINGRRFSAMTIDGVRLIDNSLKKEG